MSRIRHPKPIITVTIHSWSDLTKILSITSPTSIYVLQDFNKVIIHHNNEIISYSLDVIARLSLGASSKLTLESTYEKVSGNEGNVLFCKPGVVGKRTMGELSTASSELQASCWIFLQYSML